MAARASKSLRPRDFFSTHPVFTHADFVAAHTAGARSEHTSNALLAKHLACGRLVRIKRGIYAAVPTGVDPAAIVPDPFLVATKLRPDAVVAYHAALAFHGRAYSVWNRHTYLTAGRARPFSFRGQDYQPVQVPAPVRHLRNFGGGILMRAHAGGEVRVTSLERCLVDLLHSPEHGGGWEEIWRSLEMVEYFELNEVVQYALLLKSAVTAARVGFMLEQHRELWMVGDEHLARLVPHTPAQPHYLSPGREPGKLIAPWNLVVPLAVLERRWEE